MDEKIREKIIYALTIEERKKAFVEQGFLIGDDTILIDEIWLSKRTLCSGSNFDEMLKAEGISKDEFSFLIKKFTHFETKILLDFVKKQEWYRFYIKIRDDFAKAKHEINNLYLTEIFNIYIENTISSIDCKNILLSQEAKKDLIYDICLQINQITWKVLVTEIGKSKKNEYRDYLDFLKRNFDTIDKLEQLYFSYPVLLRLLIQKTLDITNSICEMLLNLDNCFHEAKEVLEFGNNVIEKVQLGLGDTHDEGKAVTKIVFRNGKTFYYKPKNLYIEKSFYELVQEFNIRLEEDLFYVNKVFYHKEFTIETVVENIECTDLAEVKRYYYRVGAILALMTILQGTDFHSENIIANGSFPVIVDFETFFSHKEYKYYGMIWNNIDIIETLLSTAMLPTQACTNNEEKKGIEIGGISGGEAVQLPTPRLIPKNIFTLDMEFEDKLLWKKEDKNIPILRKGKQSYKDYVEDLGRGFSRILFYILENKSYLKEYVIKAFDNLRVREVLKPTVIYYDLIQYANHPSYLENMVDLERLFSNSYSYPYSNKKVVKYEIESLLHLEVPLFYTFTSKRNIYYNEKKIERNIFDRAAMQYVSENISYLNRQMIDNARAFLQIRLSEQPKIVRNVSISDIQKKSYSKKSVEKALFELVQDLSNSAIYSQNREFVTWKTIGEDPNEVLYRNMDESIYSGRSGVLFVLEEYLKYYHNDKISDLRDILKESIITNYFPEDTSLYDGSNGCIYSTMRFDSNIDPLILNKFLWNIINSTSNEIDMLSGISSYIPVLDFMMKKYEDKRLCYESFQKIAYKIKQKLITEKGNLKGFGHGYMGILYTLCLLEKNFEGQYINDIKLLVSFLKEDLAKIKTLNSSWCNGISGIGLAALKCTLYLNDTLLITVIDKCLCEIEKHNSIVDASICHGLGSEVEFLIEYQKHFGVDIQNLIDDKVFRLLQFYEKNNYFQIYEADFCKNWGLFTGRCGIIYVLLRYLHPDIPSVLTLEFEE